MNSKNLINIQNSNNTDYKKQLDKDISINNNLIIQNENINIDIDKDISSKDKNIDQNNGDYFLNIELNNKLKNYSNKYIELNENGIINKVKILEYPILISEKINTDYYSDIYKYLYIVKHNLDIDRYTFYISNINIKSKKD